MRGHRASSSLTELMFEHPDDNSRPEPTAMWKGSSGSGSSGGGGGTRSSSLPLPAFMAAAAEKRPHWRRHRHQRGAEQDGAREGRPRRTVSLCVFVTSLLCFCVLALALGLGLGLGWPRYKTVEAPSSSSLRPPFNASSYYGLPADLEFVPIERLINTTELELKTGFVVEKKGDSESKRERDEEEAAAAVREYEFNVTQAYAAPDGFRKPMMLVNGQSPGPLVEANSGDRVRVRVNNLMANWSTAIHWHGIDQHGSTWMDGVAGVSQCGIPPGRSFTYDFRVSRQRGTFWWHAHLSVQYTDGVYGPLIIHDPDEMVPDTDEEKIIFVSDVYHTYGSVLLTSYLNPSSQWVPFESGVEPLPDNLLLNGQNTYDCSVESTTFPPPSEDSGPEQGPYYEPSCTGGRPYTTRVRRGSRVRLRLINASSFLSYWFSVDDHLLDIVELDGVEIEPIAAQRGVYLNVGQRVSVILTADADGGGVGEARSAEHEKRREKGEKGNGNFAIRATLPKTCFLPYAPYSSAGLEKSAQFEAVGVLSYYGPDDSTVSTITGEVPIIGSKPGNTSNPYGVENNGLRGDVWEGCDDMPFDAPRPMRARRAYDVSDSNRHYIEYAFRQAQDVNRIFINKTAYAPLPHNATLWKAVEQQFTADAANSYNSWDFGLNQQVLLVPDADKGAQIVINSRDAMEHPWHLHGHTFQIVGWGPGYFGEAENGTTWNLENPMRRDTVTVPAFSHIVIRFLADNPGLWALHCHVAWHMEGGMFLALAERPADLADQVANSMDAETRRVSRGFCGAEGASDDQAFGVEADYDPQV